MVVTRQSSDSGAAPRPKAPAGLDKMLAPILPPSYEQTLGHAERVELATDRRIRQWNKVSYRLNHWPIWIWVFFIAPGPLTFDLFEHGFDRRLVLWLGAVVVGTGIAGLRGRLPGVEPRPVHHPVHRGQAEPPLPPRLLHLRAGARSSPSRC